MPGPASIAGFIAGIWFAALGFLLAIIHLASRGRWQQ